MTEDWVLKIREIKEKRGEKLSVDEEILLADFVRDTKERMAKEALK